MNPPRSRAVSRRGRRANETHGARLIGEDRQGERGPTELPAGQKVVLTVVLASRDCV
jgi:hypothetical protein